MLKTMWNKCGKSVYIAVIIAVYVLAGVGFTAAYSAAALLFFHLYEAVAVLYSSVIRAADTADIIRTVKFHDGEAVAYFA